MTIATGTTFQAPHTQPNTLRIGGLDGLLYAGLFMLFATSGFVFTEPAPYDGILILIIGAVVVTGIKVPKFIAPLFVLSCLVAAGHLIGSSQAYDLKYAGVHALIKLYLSSSVLLFACLAAAKPQRFMTVTMIGTTIAALLTGLAGVIGILDLHPKATELFTLYDRAKGGFKDPNVMGPFLILPVIYGVHQLLSRPLSRAWVWLGIIPCLALAIFLSFSRGAWAHLVLSGAIYLGIYFIMAPSVIARTRAIVLTGVAIVIMVVGVSFAMGVGKINSLFEQRAALTQSYDTNEKGRFAGQRKAAQLAAENPGGLGAGGFTNYHGEEVHNVYLNAFMNGGWLAGFSYLALVGATIFVGLRAVFIVAPAQPLLMPVYATFLGLALEGLIIDTDHWRHFYLIVGLVWGLSAHIMKSGVRTGGNGSIGVQGG